LQTLAAASRLSLTPRRNLLSAAGHQVGPNVDARGEESAHSASLAVPHPLGHLDSVRPRILTLALSVYGLAVGAVCLHLLFAGRYGYFRDELYYAACGQHLAWGYVDHPPLAPLLARLSRAVLGDSLYALRFLPALASAAKVLLAGWIARELGGRRFAQFFASFCALIAPIYLTFDSFFSMNSFEPLFWTGSAAVVLRILNGGRERLWLLFGAIAGFGILNKHSMLFFGSGLTVGLLLTPTRRHFTRPWIWLGASTALLIFLPNFLWEIRNGWPILAVLRSVLGTKYSTVAPLDYVWQQTLLTHPLAAPVWLAGLWFLLRDQLGKKYVVLAIAYLTVLLEMLFLHGKIYYLAPAYIMLLAAGAVWIEARLIPQGGMWLRPALVTPLALGALIAAPLAMPVLSVEAAIKYCRFWDVQAIHVENVPQGDLPQLFGDMFGWQEQVASIASIYSKLSPADRQQAAILAYNYGQASSVDYFGPRYGLPPAISGHNQYGDWGPRQASGEVVIAIGFTQDKLRTFFDEVTPAASVSPRYALPEESGLTLFVCRRPKQRLDLMWPQFKWLG
jgi:dolichyl-phosphate-mannose-protein mannosyltransferase